MLAALLAAKARALSSLSAWLRSRMSSREVASSATLKFSRYHQPQNDGQ